MNFNKSIILLITISLIISSFQSCVSRKKVDEMIAYEKNKAIETTRINAEKEYEKERRLTQELFDQEINQIWGKYNKAESEKNEYLIRLGKALSRIEASNQASFVPSEGYKNELLLNEIYDETQAQTQNYDNAPDYSQLNPAEMTYLLNQAGLNPSNEDAIKFTNLFSGGYDMPVEYISRTNANDESRVTLKNSNCPFEALIRAKFSDIKVKYIDENETWYYRFGQKTKKSFFGDFYFLEIFSVHLLNNSKADFQIKYFESFEKRLGRIKNTNIQGNGLNNFMNPINQCYE
ncbi:hypothetical protein [Aquimarina sp. AU474]|uniref:hypothetical protein n=1 Tax=Aquimarina sp. AU474 TaxID=2108529 RepID=UPI000D698820|nr:hypothetical protein [Aquimarina sp. AU474]